MEVNRKENIDIEAQAAVALDKLSHTKATNSLVSYSVDKLWEAHCRHENIDIRKSPPYQIQKIKRAFYGGISQLLALQAGPLSKLTDIEAGNILREFIVENNKYWDKERAKK